MNRFTARSLITLAIALPLAAQEHDLRVQVEKGASVWLEQSTVQAQEIDMGQVMETENTMTMTMQLTVKEVTDDGSVIVEAKLARVRGAFGVPQMGDFPFDSIDNADKNAGKNADAGAEEEVDDGGGFGAMMPDFDKIGAAAGSIAGSKFIAKVDSYGRVESIDGVEQAVAAMQKRAGKMGGQMLAGSFSENAMKNMISSAFGERPTRPIAQGESWERERESDGGIGTGTKVTATLAQISDKLFEVTGKGTIEKPDSKPDEKGDDESEEEAMVREMRENMKLRNGKVSFRSVVSREDGFLVEARTEMSMELSMPGPFGDIEMKNKTTIVTRRTTEQAAMAREKKQEDK